LASLARSAVSLARRFKGRNELQLSLSLYGLAQVLLRLGKMAEAIRTFQEALALRQKMYSAQHPSVIDCRLQVGFPPPP
jgi:hypothetical protein